MSGSMLRRWAGLGACTVVAIGGLAGVPTPSAAHPGQPSPVFDPNVVSWASYRNYAPAAFDTLVAQQDSAGRIPIDIDADASGGSYVLGGVFQTNLDSRPWMLRHGLTDAQLDREINANVNLMRLVDLETYVVGGTRRYAALWVARNVAPFVGWDYRRNVTRAQLDTFVDAQRAAGWLPIDIDGYQEGGDTRYSVISMSNVENVAWTLVRDLTSDEFGAVFDTLRHTHRPLVADSTQSPNGQRFAGIWLENRNGRGWTILRNLTVDQWAAAWQAQLDAGNRVINFERYATASGTRYLGIWRQNR